MTDDRVPGFVVGGEFLLILAHDHGLALRAHHDLVLGSLKVAHVYAGLVGTRSKQGRLVDQVGKISTRETRRAARDVLRLDVI